MREYSTRFVQEMEKGFWKKNLK